jgi:hypothetical protein
MKTNLGSGSGRLLCNAKRTGLAATSVAASAALLFAGGLVFQAAGQADDFNDGNDTSPAPAWSRYNPLGGGTWSFPGGNSYRIEAAASPDPGNHGPGRSASIRPVTYTNFYVAVDIVNWDDSLHQVAGVMARIGNVGPGTTTGYLFSHDRGNPLSSTAGDMDIVRLSSRFVYSAPSASSPKYFRLVYP